VILPLLWAAGYSRREIHSRVQDSNGQYPDYTLLPDDREHRWWVEAKAWNVRLEHSHANQSLNYANQNGGRWVLLTNGQTWRLYDNHIHAEAAQKLIAEVSLRDRPKFERFLTAIGKEAVLTGKRDQFAGEARIARVLDAQLTHRDSVVTMAICKALRTQPGLAMIQAHSVVDYFRARAAANRSCVGGTESEPADAVSGGNDHIPTAETVSDRTGHAEAGPNQRFIRELGYHLIDSSPDLVRWAGQALRQIRFHSRAWESPKLREDWPGWKRECMLYLEVDNHPRQAQLYAYVGPGPANLRLGLVQVAERHSPPFSRGSRSMGDKWTQVYRRQLTQGCDLSKSDRASVEQVVRSQWLAFIREDLPRMDEAIRSEKWLWEP
jgi:hypothetical protein